ncbi:MAG: thiamine diphosphokinase [Actinomycetota bacterium]
MSNRRALIVAAAAPGQLDGIADRPELLIAADSGVHAVLDRGWVPDLVVGDLDSARRDAIDAAAAAGATVEQAAIDKDETDLELALRRALDRGVQAAHVIVRGDGRIDHQLANLVCLAAPDLAGLDLVASIGEHTVWVVRGERRLDLASGRHLALVPIGGPARVTSVGVAFPLDAAVLSPFAGRGIANEVVDPPVRLVVHDGVVLVLSSPTRTSDRDDAPA